jgi:hypothetical protein
MRTASASSANGHRCEHRTEDLFARQPRSRRDIAQQLRLDVVAAGRRVGDDPALPRHRDALVRRFVQETAHAFQLPGTDQRTAIEIAHRRADIERLKRAPSFSTTSS